MTLQPSGELDKRIVMYQDWNEVDGKIYYRYRFEGEKEWHIKLTPFKEKPMVYFKYFSDEEAKYFKAAPPK